MTRLRGGWRHRTTTHTIQMSVQLLKPGELASSHRHNFGAFRFIVEGQGAYTVVDGEEFLMEPGDLIPNPPMHWHGHRNDPDIPEPVRDVWREKFAHTRNRPQQRSGPAKPQSNVDLALLDPEGNLVHSARCNIQ